MRNPLLSDVLLVCLVASQCCGAVAPGWVVQQVSQGGYISGDAAIQASGHNVAWREYVGGRYQVKFWDGTTARLISDPNNDCDMPAISGSNVTWREFAGSNVRIMLYDGATHIIRQMPSGDSGGVPRLSGANVVWGERVGGYVSVMFWNGTGTSQISSGGDCGQPVVSGGNVAWSQNSGGSVMFWNGSALTPIAQTGDYCLNLRIWGAKLVWIQAEDSTPTSPGKVMFWDGTTVRQVSATAGCTEPRIWDSNVVWLENNQVMLYDGSTTRALTANSKTKSSPAIWQNMVAWNEKPVGMPVSLIYLWDGTSIVRLTDMPGCKTPSISEGNIAWLGYNEDYDFQVMFAEPGIVPAPLVGDVNNDSTVNLVDFTLMAGNWLVTSR
jgi:hypothetical protein